MTPSTALRLAKFFNVSPEFWVNLQIRWDLYHAQKNAADELKKIKPLKTPQANELIAGGVQGTQI